MGYTTGATRLFIDKIQFGVTQTAIGTRDNSIGLLRMGSSVSGTYASNFSIEDLIIYDTVQHVADYVSDYTLPETEYSTDNPYVELNTPLRMEGLDGFIEVSTKTGSDEIKSVIKKNDNWQYIIAGVWINTTGTNYTESNTTADIETNKETFTTTKVNTKYRFFLHSENGSTTPELDLITVSYNFAGEDFDLTQTIIYGNVLDIGSNIPNPAIFQVKSIYTVATTLITTNEKINIDIDTDGYFEADLYTDDIIPEFLYWYFPNIKMFKTNFLVGIHKFSELTIIGESDAI